jgi:hypothetical protein
MQFVVKTYKTAGGWCSTPLSRYSVLRSIEKRTKGTFAPLDTAKAALVGWLTITNT